MAPDNKKVMRKPLPMDARDMPNTLRLLARMLFDQMADDIIAELAKNGHARRPAIHLNAAFHRKIREVTPACIYRNLHATPPTSFMGVPVRVVNQENPYSIFIGKLLP